MNDPDRTHGLLEPIDWSTMLDPKDFEAVGGFGKCGLPNNFVSGGLPRCGLGSKRDDLFFPRP